MKFITYHPSSKVTIWNLYLWFDFYLIFYVWAFALLLAALFVCQKAFASTVLHMAKTWWWISLIKFFIYLMPRSSPWLYWQMILHTKQKATQTNKQTNQHMCARCQFYAQLPLATLVEFDRKFLMKNDPLKKRGKVQLVKWIIAHSKRSCACLIDACVLSNDLEYTDHELQTQTHTQTRSQYLSLCTSRRVQLEDEEKNRIRFRLCTFTRCRALGARQALLNSLSV